MGDKETENKIMTKQIVHIPEWNDTPAMCCPVHTHCVRSSICETLRANLGMCLNNGSAFEEHCQHQKSQERATSRCPSSDTVLLEPIHLEQI